MYVGNTTTVKPVIFILAPLPCFEKKKKNEQKK